ncbi:MAG: hypothetical protein HC927_11265 [Deltaproteobacteria bacterium]|nr:hypothetical protein [Deltaproteobacteria bacterium]
MEFRTEAESSDSAFIYLDRRVWDDHGFQTTFDVILLEPGQRAGDGRCLGTVKILQLGATRTELPPAFDALPEEYCSLAQSLTYDANVDELDLGLHRVLRDLRSLSTDERARYEAHPGFQLSLLRFASARYLYETATATLTRQCNVHVCARLDGFDADHELALELDPTGCSVASRFSSVRTGQARRGSWMRSLVQCPASPTSASSAADLPQSRG